MNSKGVKRGAKAMSKIHKQILRRHRKTIMNNLDPKYIVDGLISEGIITLEMKNSIMACKETMLQVSTLLDVLERRGDNAFGALLNVLKEDYTFLYRELCEDPDSDIPFNLESISVSENEQINLEDGPDAKVHYPPHYRLPEPLQKSNIRRSQTEEEIYDDIPVRPREGSRYSGSYRKYLNKQVENGGIPALASGVIVQDTLGYRINKNIGRNSLSTEDYTYVSMTNYESKYATNSDKLNTFISSSQSMKTPERAPIVTWSLGSREDIGIDGQTDATEFRETDTVLFTAGTKVMVDVDADLTSRNTNMVPIFDVNGWNFEIAQDCVHVHGEITGKTDIYPRPLTSENAKFFLRGKPMGTYLIYYDVVPNKTSHGSAELALVTPSGSVDCFKIIQFTDSRFGLSLNLSFACLEDLIEHHKISRENLPISLMRPLSNLDSVSHLATLLPQDLIIDPDELKFEEKKALARRSYATISKALYQDRNVSVKMGASSDQTLIGMENSIEEVKLMSQLDHEAILSCVGASLVSESKIHIVTEDVGSGDLLSVLSEKSLSDIPDSVFMDIIKQLLSAVAYLHSKYIIHRALYVRNIFADDVFSIKLGGFSSAKKAINGTYKSEAHEAVTSPWAAPEVNDSNLFSSASDVWDLALTILDIYNGGFRTPCKAEMAVLSLILDGSLPKRPERCPVHVFKILRQCLVSSPSKRPTALKLLNLIDTLDSHGPFYGEDAFEVEVEDTKLDNIDTVTKDETENIKKVSKLRSLFRFKKTFKKKESNDSKSSSPPMDNVVTITKV